MKKWIQIWLLNLLNLYTIINTDYGVMLNLISIQVEIRGPISEINIAAPGKASLHCLEDFPLSIPFVCWVASLVYFRI